MTGSTREAFVDLVKDDQRSPLHGCIFEDMSARDGGLHLTADPGRFDTFADILARCQLDELTRYGTNTPPQVTKTMAPAGAFAAHFVECMSIRISERFE